MSLLLDALKKAADDKKKISSGKENSKEASSTDAASTDDLSTQTISNPVGQSDNSLDLELHINVDDSPELDESALYNIETHDEPEPDIDEMVNELKAADGRINEHSGVEADIKPASADNTHTTGSVTDAPVTPPEPASENKTETPAKTAEPAQSQETGGTTESNAEPVSEELTLQPASTTSNFENNINNEHALSALINKSNHHTRKQKKRQIITISSLIALIFIGSGLYFYIQLDTSNQASVNRRPILPESTTNTPVSKPQVKQPGTIEKLPESNKQEIHTPVIHAAKQTSSKKTTIKPPISKPVLNIIRTKKPDPVHTLLRSAYTEFNKSNYQASEKLYLQVLLRESRNRDALLGIAAIAIKQSRYEVARQKYQYLLRLNPRDSLATAGLSSIKSLSNPRLNESQLKFMIKQQPDTPHLYFALGSLYSSLNKWPEAQSAFFSAWSADNKNADYAYNLAVSLDHMNHPAQALNYYQLSIKLMSGSNSNFSIKNTQKRIDLLQESYR